MVELPVKDTDDFAQWLLESYNFNGETIMVAPTGGFYSDPALGKKQVRMAYVLKKKKILENLLRFLEMLFRFTKINYIDLVVHKINTED